MQISQNLKLKQSQSLVMTPQLQQAIKLLQLNNLELTNLVNKELEENPFLENESVELDNQNDQDTEKTDELDESFENGESIADEPCNDDFENRWDNDANFEFNSKHSSTDSVDVGSVIEQTLSNKVSLKSILSNQADLEFNDDEDKKIAEILIDYVDENGWITENLEDIEEFSGFKLDQIEKVLERMQCFEPNGVFARNLKECLKIQLINENNLDSKKEIIIENIDLLGSGNIKGLQKLTGLKEEKLKDEIRLIRALNPKPGCKYSTDNDNIFHPDVIVTKNNSDWAVELNHGTLPKININEDYVKEIERLQCGESDKKFINESLNSARWLLKAIQQRNVTTLKISSEIVNQQKEFFEKGKKYLKPMVLKDVAKKINMHESTVSRVTTGLLILTPRGGMPLKSFFSVNITSRAASGDASAAAVRNMVKRFINQETPGKPLSDEAICKLISDEGIDLARRTVAKYREMMNIPSSAQRRMQARLASFS